MFNLALILVFGITALYEQCALQKEERWYVILKDKIHKIKHKREEEKK